VLELAGIDPDEYSGFAAGFGVERFAMVIHQISDLREFFKNDKRFLKQFPHFYDDGKSRIVRKVRLSAKFRLQSFDPTNGDFRFNVSCVPLIARS
jgi:O-phosphoseryl-tRNA(Cys) synthetase